MVTTSPDLNITSLISASSLPSFASQLIAVCEKERKVAQSPSETMLLEVVKSNTELQQENKRVNGILHKTIEEQNKAMKALSDENLTLKSNVAALEGRVKEMEKSHASGLKAVNDLVKEKDTSISTKDAKITALNQQIAQLAIQLAQANERYNILKPPLTFRQKIYMLRR